MHCCLIIFLVVVVAVFYEKMCNHCPSVSLVFDQENRIQFPELYKITDEIPVVLWENIKGSSHHEKITTIGLSRKPIKILQSPAIFWNANKLWKVSNAQAIDHISKLHLENIVLELESKMNDSSSEDMKDRYSFMHDLIHVWRLGNGDETNFDSFQNKDVLNVSLYDFLHYIRNRKYCKLCVNESNHLLHYKNSIRNFYQDFRPFQWLIFSEKSVELIANKLNRKLSQTTHMNIHISPFNYFSATKYDITHNFYYQIDGESRVLISDPSQTSYIFPYPSPSLTTISQIKYNFYFLPFTEWKSRKSFPFEPPAHLLKTGNNRISAMQTQLRSGELLYIPPFYWKQWTTTDSHSILFESMTLGFEEIFTVLSDSLEKVLPFVLRNGPQVSSSDDDNIVNKEKQNFILFQLAYFSRYLIDNILKALPTEEDKETVSELDDTLHWNVIHSWITSNILNNQYVRNEDECLINFDPLLCPQYGNTTESVMLNMRKTSKTWAFVYKQMRLYILDDQDIIHIRNVMLANHLQQIVQWFVGESNVCRFLQCLVHERYSSLYVLTKEEILEKKLRQQMQ